MKSKSKKLLLSCLLCLAMVCTFFLANTSIYAAAHEDSHVDYQFEYEKEEENYHNDISQEKEELPFQPYVLGAIEDVLGTGCTTANCGSGRENGYSSNYMNAGCRQWQKMPAYSPIYKYRIEESSLSDMRFKSELDANTIIDQSIHEQRRQQFIQNVDAAAAIWNSARMYDGTGSIVTLTKVTSNRVDVCPVSYVPNLDYPGYFWPVLNFEYLELRDYSTATAMHEFGHMLGLQDLDRNNSPSLHSALMGYAAGSNKMHYQDIQGLAVANFKHTNHVFTRYVRDGIYYNHFCFYCDGKSTDLWALSGSAQMVLASSCSHDFQPLVSAGNASWYKCTKCYKVLECGNTENEHHYGYWTYYNSTTHRRTCSACKYYQIGNHTIGGPKCCFVSEIATIPKEEDEFDVSLPDNEKQTE